MTTMDSDAVNAMVMGMQSAILESVKLMMAEMQNPVTATPSVERTSSPKLMIRDFMKSDKFSGGDAEWQEWSFDFKTLTNSINPAMEKWFTQCEDPKHVTLTQDVLDAAYRDERGSLDPKDLQTRSKELFSILCTLTSGEAKTLIRDQTDGLAAYQILHRTYSRNTLTKEIRLIRSAMVPKTAKKVDELI